jgi:orotate phosphoribosyltransferase
LTLARDIGAVALLRGGFVLRSGQRSDVYFDKYQFEARPALLRRVAEELALLVPKETEVLAGLELGGVPLATIVSQVTGLPTAFVRKQRKSYGTSRVAEGVEVAGRRVTVVEDVVTSGGAILDSLPHLRGEQANVQTALCVVLRQQSAIQRLADEGVQLLPLLTFEQIFETSHS